MTGSRHPHFSPFQLFSSLCQLTESGSEVGVARVWGLSFSQNWTVSHSGDSTRIVNSGGVNNNVIQKARRLFSASSQERNAYSRYRQIQSMRTTIHDAWEDNAFFRISARRISPVGVLYEAGCSLHTFWERRWCILLCYSKGMPWLSYICGNALKNDICTPQILWHCIMVVMSAFKNV